MEIHKNDGGRGQVNFNEDDCTAIKSYFKTLNCVKAEEDVIGVRLKDVTFNYSLMIKTENYIHNMPPEQEKYTINNGDIIFADDINSLGECRCSKKKELGGEKDER